MPVEHLGGSEISVPPFPCRRTQLVFRNITICKKYTDGIVGYDWFLMWEFDILFSRYLSGAFVVVVESSGDQSLSSSSIPLKRLAGSHMERVRRRMLPWKFASPLIHNSSWMHSPRCVKSLNESWTLDRLSSGAVFLLKAKLTATPSIRTRFAKAFLLILNFSSSRLHIKFSKDIKFRNYNIYYLFSDSNMIAKFPKSRKTLKHSLQDAWIYRPLVKDLINFRIQGHKLPLHGRVWQNR